MADAARRQGDSGRVPKHEEPAEMERQMAEFRRSREGQPAGPSITVHIGGETHTLVPVDGSGRYRQ